MRLHRAQAHLWGSIVANQKGCIYFTAFAELENPVVFRLQKRFSLYHLPQYYPTGFVEVTGFEGNPYPVERGISPSYFQTAQCQPSVIYVLSITPLANPDH